MFFTKKKIWKTMDMLQQYMVVEKTPMENLLVKECGYKKHDNCPAPDASWETFPFGDCLDGIDKHYWFYQKMKTPEKTNENYKLYFDLRTGREGQWDTCNPQGLLYLNGKAEQGMDINHTDAELEFGKEFDMHLYFYTGMQGGKFLFEPSLKIIDTKIEQLYYDIRVPYESLDCMDDKDDNAVTTVKYLEMACNLLDLRKPHSPEFYASVDNAIEFLKNEYYLNKDVCGKTDLEVTCIGHTHIDVAWLWTLAQTEEKAQRSFATVLKLMEKYDEYKFMSSQPQLYEYVKEYDPEIYERIKQRVKEGRFEPEGAMWVEADCNLTSGESLIRQIMFGKKFFKDEFGVDNKTLWLPDVFGYSAALPQILKKCGIDKFVTSKISWNDTNQLPYDVFMWEGLDGTEIFTAFITAQNYQPKGERYTTYVCDITPSMTKGSRHRLQQKAYTKRAMMTYGYGDGGGGPVRRMLEFHRRLQYGIPGIPKTVLENSTEYLYKLKQDFEKASCDLKKMPKWVGELYLEFHRGTYTSIAKNKRNNRKSEFLYQTAEQMSVLANRLSGTEYPKDTINAGWKTILLNQFHDIIPGSSIEEVYNESDKQYAEIQKAGNEIVSGTLETLSKGLKKGVAVYNPNGFVTDGFVQFDGKTAYVENVPAAGWKVLDELQYESGIQCTDKTLENKYFVLTLDDKANIVSLYDKEAKREIIEAGKSANALQAFEDMPYNHDNWELSPYYKQKMWDVDNVISVEPISDGARAGFKIVRNFLNSTITQNLYMNKNSRRIDFETVVDWKEENIVLKAAFPVNVHTDKAVYDTQFGYLERPTHSNTPYDAAKFEVCAHKFADISEDDYGVALLNDCKYGHNTEGNTLKITMLKAGTFPNKNADKEVHTFTYSLYPHIGNHKQGGVVQNAYALNRPLVAFETNGNGSLSDTFSLVSCDKENVIVETIKKAENGEATVIRAYDAYNRRGEAEFTFGFDVKKAYLCDMLENKLQELPVSDNKVKVSVGNFEIVTVMAE